MVLMKFLGVTTAVLSVFAPALAGDVSQQESVPSFTNRDLEWYTQKPVAEPGAPDEMKKEDAVLPTERPEDAGAILRENSEAVVAVAAFDKTGVPFSHGSGFIFRQNGAVITSYHVIDSASEIRVKASGKVLGVEGLLYADKGNDIAILKARGDGLRTVKLGDSDMTEEGERVYVMSNPQGVGNILSEGILRGSKLTGNNKWMLLISAPFSTGSSGGPVFNKNGEVIGVATFVLENTQDFKETSNLNFAVPINVIGEGISAEKVIELKDALSEDYRQTADHWLRVGNDLNKKARFAEAAEAYRKALAINSDLAGALNGLGVAYMKLNKYEEAVKVYERALRLEPDSAWVYSNLGLAYIESGIYQKAIDALKQAVRIMPDLESAHLNLGLAYRRWSKYEDAAEAYRSAIRISPNSSDAHFGLGLTYLDLNDKNSALQEADELRNIDPALADKLSNIIKR